MNHPDHYQSLTNLVLVKVFQYLSVDELARNSTVCKHWYRASTSPQICRKACVTDKRDYHSEKLQWLSSRTGIHSLTLDIDLRKVNRGQLTHDVEKVLAILANNSRHLRDLTFHLPIDRFLLKHNHTELSRLYAELLSQEIVGKRCPEVNRDCFNLPALTSLHFKQKWEAWQFNLPALRHLSTQVIHVLESIRFDPLLIETLDLGSNSVDNCISIIEKCDNVQTLILNVNEFNPGEMPRLWRVISELSALHSLVLWQFDDFNIKATELLSYVALPSPDVRVFFGVLDPCFKYQFDASSVPFGNPLYVFGDNFITDSPPNVEVNLDHNLEAFQKRLDAEGIYCPGINRDITELAFDLLEVGIPWYYGYYV